MPVPPHSLAPLAPVLADARAPALVALAPLALVRAEAHTPQPEIAGLTNFSCAPWELLEREG